MLLVFAGFDSRVYIYALSEMGKAAELKPAFTHQGHWACSQHPQATVTMATLWHPGNKRLVISAASDGSLHAWDYV